jgi:hypothetical protein
MILRYDATVKHNTWVLILFYEMPCNAEALKYACTGLGLLLCSTHSGALPHRSPNQLLLHTWLLPAHI